MKLTILKHRERSSNIRISLEQATDMYTNMEFHELLNMAQARRMAMNPGNQVTYLVDRNINYTTVSYTHLRAHET